MDATRPTNNMSPTLVSTRNDPYNFRADAAGTYEGPHTLGRKYESNVRQRMQNVSKAGLSHHQSMDNIEAQNMVRMMSLDNAIGTGAGGKQAKAQYPTSAIHQLATGKNLSYIERNPRNDSIEIEGRMGHSLPKKINEIRFEPHHYHRDRSDCILIHNGNGANGRSQFLQSPGLPGFKNGP